MTIYRQKLQLVVNKEFPVDRGYQITNSKDIEVLLRRFIDTSLIEYYESFWVMFCDTIGQPLCYAKIAEGCISTAVVDMKVVFSHAVLCGASIMVATHNHPSGNLKPSQRDIELTRKMTNAANLLDIKVIDHIILTSEGYYSFADEGMM